MKVAYISVTMPYGNGEPFFIQETKEMLNQGCKLVIIPRSPQREITNTDAFSLKDHTIKKGLFSISILIAFLVGVFTKLSYLIEILRICNGSRNLGVFFKNIVVIPKSFWIAHIVQKQNITHIHSPWALSTSSIALFASILSGKPWSFAAHRGDILEDNLLEEKLKRTTFARFISEKGKEEAFSIIGNNYDNKVSIIHMGVEFPEKPVANFNREIVNILWPAHLIPVKGHLVFLECFKEIKKSGCKFNLLLAGEGYLKDEITDKIKAMGLMDNIQMLGFVKHNMLLQMYEEARIDITVLPSLHEGIPVALMDAMSYGVPVISTDVGGTKELLEGGNGVLISNLDVQSFTEELIKLITDSKFRQNLGKKGRLKVEQEFNVKRNMTLFLNEIKLNST